METVTIVLYPSPGMGHLIAMVELGKFILHHHPSVAVTILLTPVSFNTGSTAAYIRQISATESSIQFHHLPLVVLDIDLFPSMEAIIFEVLRRSNHAVGEALKKISRSAGVSAFIIDFFCWTAQAVAAELSIPTYYFLTSGAAVVALFLYFPVLHSLYDKSYKDLNEILHVPGVPPFPSSDMVLPLLDRSSTDYRDFLEVSRCFLSSSGLIVNTIERLESRALEAIRSGLCNPGNVTPPVFCVGPLLDTQQRSDSAGVNECLNWLEKQPIKSVVYICFGSLGILSARQLREIAIGLEKSRQRFLWVVRSPPSEDKSRRFLPPPEPDLDVLLPPGFLNRTADQGLVVKSWAPQVAILRHAAVGGFVTHCGWNSILEAVCCGAPMVAWPLYAEQKFNRAVLVEEMKVAVAVEEYGDGLVPASELERRLWELMSPESEKGLRIRKVVNKNKGIAEAAMAAGGSSIAALNQLHELLKCKV